MIDVAVIGGGISGLAAAYAVRTFGKGMFKTAVFEKEKRAGGWIKTLRKEGFLFDLGPHTIRTRGSGLEALSLALELNLESELLFPSKKSHARYILRNGTLEKIPSGLISLLFSPLTKSLLPALCRDLLIPRGGDEDETVADFFSRRFSKNMAESLIDPMIKGIYAGDSRKLSLKACFPDLYQAEKEYRSLLLWTLFGKSEKTDPKLKALKSKGPLFSFKRGTGVLTEALEKTLEDSLFLGDSVASIHFDKTWTLILSSGKEVKARAVIGALPLNPLKQLLKPHIPEISSVIDIPYASLAVVPLGFKKELPCMKDGFGYLVPTSEKSPLLGAIFDSSIFPDQGSGHLKTRMTAMLGGDLFKDVIEKSDEEIKELAIKELSSHLHSPLTPDFIEVHRARSAIAQYIPGHLRKVQELQTLLEKKLPHFDWIGSSVGGVSIGDCIRGAKRAAIKRLDLLQRDPKLLF